MNDISRYKYEKRIKDLEIRVRTLEEYRYKAMIIFDALQENGDSGNGISKKWLLLQFRSLFK